MKNNVLELGSFKEMRKDTSESLKFKIATVPEEITEDVLDHMTKYFLLREPLSEYIDLINDPLGVEAEKIRYRKYIKEGTAIVAIAESPGPLKDRIIGANMTYISLKDDDQETLEDENLGMYSEVYQGAKEAKKRANIFEKFGVDKVLNAAGLSVHPDYHGYHIGERLLQCREPLCRHFGIKVTATMFTSPASIHLSHKVGFIAVYEEEYSKFRYQGKAVFEGIPGKFEYSALVYS